MTKEQMHEYLSSCETELAYDSWSGKPVVWGYYITRMLGDAWDEFCAVCFRELGLQPYCIDMGKWGMATKFLSIRQAVENYGLISKIITGPRGGLRRIVFEDKDKKETQFFVQKWWREDPDFPNCQVAPHLYITEDDYNRKKEEAFDALHNY